MHFIAFISFPVNSTREFPKKTKTTKRTHLSKYLSNISNPGRFDRGSIPGWDCLYQDNIEHQEGAGQHPVSGIEHQISPKGQANI